MSGAGDGAASGGASDASRAAAGHPLDEAIRLTPTADGRLAGATSPAYANMVGPFGGITSAVLLQAVLLHPQRLGEPVALTVNFAGPIADGPFELEALPLRTNRSTQHWQLQLRQGADGAVCASGSAVFAARRQTWSAPEARMPTDLRPPEALARASRHRAPAWTHAYDMRFEHGGGPFELDGQEQSHSISRLWVRDDPPRALDFPALASLADSFFPRVYVRRRKVVPIGTVTLSTFFHADAAVLAAQGSGYLLGVARGLNFRNGYHDQSAELWGADGQLLASSHQMVYYRE